MLYCNEYLYHTFCNVYPIGRSKKQGGEKKKPKKVVEPVKSSESDEDDEAKIVKEGTKAKEYDHMCV